MRLDLDPKTTWKHDASPTSATSQDGDTSTPSPGSRLVMADSKGIDVGNDAVIDQAIEDVLDEFTADDTETPGSPPSQPPRTPSPLPRFNGPTIHDPRTLAQRRMLIDPLPQPVSILFTSSSSGLRQTTDSSTQTPSNDLANSIHVEPPQKSSSSDEAPTPTTPDFRLMLESYTEIPPDEISRLMDMADRVAQHRIQNAREEEQRSFRSAATSPMKESVLLSPAATTPFTRSALNLDARGILLHTPTSGLVPLRAAQSRRVDKMRTAGVKLRILQHLLPAKVLLTQTATNNELPSLVQTRAAAGYAYVALSHARSISEAGGGEEADRQCIALQGRCAFYVGVSEWILDRYRKLEQHPRSPPGRWTRFEEENEAAYANQGQAPVLDYFQIACRAKEGAYVEGIWAEEWVKYLSSKGEIEVEGDEKRASRTWWGWLGNKLNPFRVTTSFRADDGTGTDFEDDSNGNEGTSLAGLDDAAFQAVGLAEQDGDEEEYDYPSPPSSQSASIPRRRSPSCLELPKPVTSPNRQARKKPSLSFTSPPSSPRGRPIYERRGHSEVAAGRNSSFLARVTGREKQRSELEKAEEGEGALSPREGIRKRKSGEEEPGEVV